MLSSWLFTSALSGHIPKKKPEVLWQIRPSCCPNLWMPRLEHPFSLKVTWVWSSTCSHKLAHAKYSKTPSHCLFSRKVGYTQGRSLWMMMMMMMWMVVVMVVIILLLVLLLLVFFWLLFIYNSRRAVGEVFFSNKTFRRVFCSPGCRNQFLAGNAGTNNELRRVQELPGRVFG